MNFFKFKRKNEEDVELDKIIDDSRGEAKKEEPEEEFDPNSLENVLNRVESGLIGSLRIEKNINWPLILPDDIVHLRAPQKIMIKDFVLYKAHNDYALRRIIKYKDDNIFVAGDNERAYRIIKRDDIIAKAIGKERNGSYSSFNLNHENSFYTFIKVKLARFRLGKRIIGAEEDINNESLEVAIQTLQDVKDDKALKEERYSNVEVDLSGFTNPNDLVYTYLQDHKPIEADEAAI